MSDTPCVDGCGQDAATIERLTETLRLRTEALDRVVVERDELRARAERARAMGREWQYDGRPYSVSLAGFDVLEALDAPLAPSNADQVSAPTRDATATQTGECCASGRCEVCTPGYVWGM